MAETYYMHTIDGQPATFDGDQICFAHPRHGNPLRRSLAEIKADRKRTERYRRTLGFRFEPKIYGHIRVRTP